LFKNIYISYIKLFLISFFIVSFIFLSGMKYEYFQLRFFILLLLVPCIFKFYLDLKAKNYNFLIYFLFLFITLFVHTGLNLYHEQVELTNYSLFGIIFLLSIFIISYYYFDYINDNIDFIIKFFTVIFLSSCIYAIYDYHPDAELFCGGIPVLNPSIEQIELFGSRVSDVQLSFREYIFPENSHLGMIAPSIVAYFIYKITNQKFSVFSSFFMIIFIIICFIVKSSTTLYVGTVLSLVTIILFNFKVFNKKTLISFFILIVFSITILLSDSECRARFVPTYGSFISPLTIINSDRVIGGINKDLANKIENTMNTSGNLSSGIYFHALMIAKKSIIEKPFGWGINRYDQAFSHYNKIQPAKIERLNFYNNKDGTNNLVKIVVELGIFSIIFFLFCFLFLINNKISIELKLFYLPFIITQSIRGAGYFNGGFLLIVFIMLFTYISVYKKNS
jgi:hypothetical protein